MSPTGMGNPNPQPCIRVLHSRGSHRLSDTSDDGFLLTLYALEARFHLPLHPFFCNLLREYQIGLVNFVGSLGGTQWLTSSTAASVTKFQSSQFSRFLLVEGSEPGKFVGLLLLPSLREKRFLDTNDHQLETQMGFGSPTRDLAKTHQVDMCETCNEKTTTGARGFNLHEPKGARGPI